MRDKGKVPERPPDSTLPGSQASAVLSEPSAITRPSTQGTISRPTSTFPLHPPTRHLNNTWMGVFEGDETDTLHRANIALQNDLRKKDGLKDLFIAVWVSVGFFMILEPLYTLY